MKIFFRVQQRAYEITPESVSWPWLWKSLEEAKQGEIDRALEYIVDDELIEEIEAIEDLDERWETALEKAGLETGIKNGVSCFEDPEKLVDYFESRGGVDEEIAYVLIFKGRFVEVGEDGEDIARFVEEVERVEWSDFKENIDMYIEKYVE